MILFLDYMLLSSIIVLALYLNIDKLFDAWCERHKNDDDFMQKRHSLACTIDELRYCAGPFLLGLILISSWLIVPFIILQMTIGAIEALFGEKK